MAQAKSKFATRLALGVGSLLLAAGLPSSVVAIGLIGETKAFSDFGSAVSFTPASADPRIAELIAERGGSKTPLMRFTPAGASAMQANRSVTVAVRVDQKIAQALSGRKANEIASEDSPAFNGMRLAPTRYNLGVARGYNSFASSPELSQSLSGAQIPDIASLERSVAGERTPSRFAARIELEEGSSAAQSAAAVKRLGDQMLDVGGSYSLTRNLDVTAGVRLQQDRELRPLPSIEAQDSQAVYIGTQFRF